MGALVFLNSHKIIKTYNKIKKERKSRFFDVCQQLVIISYYYEIFTYIKTKIERE